MTLGRAALIFGCAAALSPAQQQSFLRLPERIAADQPLLFSRPFRMKPRDLAWLVPFGALTGVLAASDRHIMAAHIHSNPAAIARSGTVTGASLGALGGLSLAMYGLGRLRYDTHLEEGGLLAAEAFADGLIAGAALKYSIRRGGPSGGDSFPSIPAVAAWSTASAIAHRYPGWLTQAAVYSLAAAASVPGITAQKHFPSDVLIGGALGWFIGREVFRQRHVDWYPVVPRAAAPKARTRKAEHPAAGGPVLVPLDSWIYPALTRLAALGFIPDQPAGMRPWTRAECLRQLGEAEELRAWHGGSGEALRIIRALREEFDRGDSSTRFVELESVYGRYTGVSGKPLADGYNFGQTIINDYGRPLGEGSNSFAGFSAAAVAGRVSFYTRAESEQAGPYSSPAAALKGEAPQIEPVLPAARDRGFRPLEMYAGIRLGGWSLTVGRQSLWWGPGESGPLSFSSNAAPFDSFRLTSEAPLSLPGVLARLGAFRIDLIGGKLSGHHLPARPLVNGQKLTWNPTRDLELGFTRWSLFGGAGVEGFTARAVLRNLLANGATFGGAIDPGDRKSGFDFRWRPPLPGRPVTLYSDFYADDEPTPLASPRRSALSPGIYLARLPGLPRWDLRIEAPSTRLVTTDHGGFFLFWNSVYNDANTNKGYPLGNWAGRDGRGLFVRSTYWHSPRTRIEFEYRQNRIGAAFLPGGGTQNDGTVRGLLQLGPQWRLTLSTQYERYFIPLLGGPRHDVLASIELAWLPRWKLVHN